MSQSNSLSGREVFGRWAQWIGLISKGIRMLPKPIGGLVTLIASRLPARGGVLGRYLHAKSRFAGLGDCVYISNHCVFKNDDNLRVGNRVSFHEFCYIDAVGGVSIGDDVSIAHGCSIVSFEHTWSDDRLPIKYNSTQLRPVRIGNDVWIGCGVRILAGAQVGDRVIVAAGAVVKGALEAGGIYAGVPARRIRNI